MTQLPKINGPGEFVLRVAGGMARVNRRMLEWIYFLVGCTALPCFLTLFLLRVETERLKYRGILNMLSLLKATRQLPQRSLKSGATDDGPSLLTVHWHLAILPLNSEVLLFSYHVILLSSVLLSWGYVIYATRLAAQWQLKDDYPTQAHNF